MSRLRYVIAVLVLALVVAASSLPSSARVTAQTPPPTSYLKNFDNAVVSDPLPLGSDATLDVFTHSRDRNTWSGLSPMMIQHGSHCEPPPATHPSRTPHRYEDAVFLCGTGSGTHAMTALGEGGYGVIYLTPAALADFSGGEAVIRFDVSTFRASTRDWIDVWVTPWDDNLVAPLPGWLPDLQGEPRRALQFALGGSNNWEAHLILNHVGHNLPWSSTGYQTFLVPSSARRDTVEMRISRARVKVGMPAYNFWWVDTAIDPPLDWDKGVIQLGHHSYTPTKDCALPYPCAPGTWHWDNLSISPATPFTMIRSTERFYLEPSQGAPISIAFPQPSPQNAHLRVSAYGAGYQVSTDGGTTWAQLRRQPSQRDNDGSFEPYWHPIPAGTTRVLLRTTQAGWWGQAAVNHAAIWADQAQQAPPTNTPTTSPATNTPVPATVTLTSTFTTTPTATATATPTATVGAATATATSGPLGNCTVTVAPNRKSGSWSCP